MNEIAIVDWDNLPAKRELHRSIDNLPISAENKLTLLHLADLTTVIGGKVVEVGRKIIAFALALLKEFPSLTLAIIAAVVINVLLSSIPILGPLLLPLYGPLVLAAGVAVGTLAELRDGDLHARVQDLSAEFERIFK